MKRRDARAWRQSWLRNSNGASLMLRRKLRTPVRVRGFCVSNGWSRITWAGTGCRRWWLWPGASDVFGRAGEASFHVTSEEIAACGAEAIVVMLCGYNLARTTEELRRYPIPAAWSALPAVRDRRIFASDANSYFSRPGPRLAEGVEGSRSHPPSGIVPRTAGHRCPRAHVMDIIFS